MNLSEKINVELVAAMKAGDKVKVSVLRMLKSDMKYKQIELGRELEDEDCLAVVSSSAKKRRDSIEGFEKGGRADLVAQEKAELEILTRYLPQQLTQAELEEFVAQAIAESRASTPADIGAVMKVLMPKVKGRADGRKVNELVTKKLSG
jgi:uncharacterized protein YqeY